MGNFEQDIKMLEKLNPEFKKLLINTGNSLLIHSPGRVTAMPKFPIMNARQNVIRNSLKKQKK